MSEIDFFRKILNEMETLEDYKNKTNAMLTEEIRKDIKKLKTYKGNCIYNFKIFNVNEKQDCCIQNNEICYKILTNKDIDDNYFTIKSAIQRDFKKRINIKNIRYHANNRKYFFGLDLDFHRHLNRYCDSY